MYKCTNCKKKGMTYIWKTGIERAMHTSDLKCRYCNYQDKEINVRFKND